MAKIQLLLFVPGCNDECSGLLLDRLELLEVELSDKASHLTDNALAPPWEQLLLKERQAAEYQLTLHQLRNITSALQTFPADTDEDINKKAKQLLNKVINKPTALKFNLYIRCYWILLKLFGYIYIYVFES